MDSRIYILTHKRLTGQLSSTENTELARLSLIPENKSLSDEIAYLWNVSNNYFPTKDWKKDAAKDAFYKKIKTPTDIPAPTIPTSTTVNQTMAFNWKYVVGGIAALLFLALTISKLAFADKPTITAQDSIEYAQLSDETKVWLDQGAVLRIVEESASSRKVALEGEAFFDVSHDPDRPFIIDLGNDIYAQVLGTSFKAKSTHDGDNGKISVRDGRVRLYSSEHEGYDLTLYAGEEGELNPELEIENKTLNTDIKGLKSGQEEIVIIDQPLSDVFDKLGLHFGIELIADDDARLGGCPYTSTLPKGSSLDDYFDSITDVYPDIIISRLDRSVIEVEGVCE